MYFQAYSSEYTVTAVIYELFHHMITIIVGSIIEFLLIGQPLLAL